MEHQSYTEGGEASMARVLIPTIRPGVTDVRMIGRYEAITDHTRMLADGRHCGYAIQYSAPIGPELPSKTTQDAASFSSGCICGRDMLTEAEALAWTPGNAGHLHYCPASRAPRVQHGPWSHPHAPKLQALGYGTCSSLCAPDDFYELDRLQREAFYSLRPTAPLARAWTS
jgi:hypothetical protein